MKNLIEDQLNERSFVSKFLAGEISDNELDLFKNWLAERRDNRKEFDEENEIWQKINLQAKDDCFNAEKGWKNVSDKLSDGKTHSYNQIVVLKKGVFWSMTVAASVAILIAFGSFFYGTMKKKPTFVVNSAYTMVQTREGERATITLPDSTRVTMNSGSTIRYSSDFNVNDREIWLLGEAYFDVANNSDKPLQVHLINKLTVVATGTKFNIFAHNAENRIETSLEEGSIQVEIPGKDIIYVTPGQQVVYFKNNNTVMVKDVTVESFISWKENKLRFNDTPFEEALRNIARRYNVTFEIQDTRLLELKYTATFIDESIEDVMQMLKSVSPMRYTIINRTTVSDKTYLKPKIIVTHN